MNEWGDVDQKNVDRRNSDDEKKNQLVRPSSV